MLKNLMRLLQILLISMLFIMPAAAQEAVEGEGIPRPRSASNPFEVTGLPLPRFASLGSERVFMRTGPGKQYPTTWEYQREGLPVEIVMEFELWRKIKDSEGVEGWVHKSLLSGKRMGIIRGEQPVDMHRKAEDGAQIVARAEPKAIIKIEECRGLWCRVSASGYGGWMERKYIWGVYPSEEFN